MTTANSDSRRADEHMVGEIYRATITRGFIDNPAGPVLIAFGNMRTTYTTSVEQSVPRSKRDSGEGWLTAEYSILSASTHERMPHESMRDGVRGHTHEISRLIGHSLRVAIDLKELGKSIINIDYGALQAGGGTRTASTTGAYVALAGALTYPHAVGAVPGTPLKTPVAAVSVGVIDGRVYLDLLYEGSSRVEVSFNVMMTAEGKFIEAQGTDEEGTFDRDQLNNMLDSAGKSLHELITLQQEALRAPYPGELP